MSNFVEQVFFAIPNHKQTHTLVADVAYKHPDYVPGTDVIVHPSGTAGCWVIVVPSVPVRGSVLDADPSSRYLPANYLDLPPIPSITVDFARQLDDILSRSFRNYS